MKNGPKNIKAVSLCLCSSHKQNLDFLQKLSTQSLNQFFLKFDLNKFTRGLILIYQATFSYFFGGNCRYYPSCSHYAYEAYSKHSLFMATKLTLIRLLSCHPFSKKNFYDPVPISHLHEERFYEFSK